MEVVRIVLKVLFWGILPLIIFYFRYKKKLTTGFAIGSVLTCLIFGLLSVATVKEDPVERFMHSVNMKEYDQAKRDYKILIQYGPEYLEKVDESQIIDPVFFQKVKKDVLDEYFKIATRYEKDCRVKKIFHCKDVVTQEKNLHRLKHAETLLKYAGYIGGEDKKLSESLKKKIAVGEELMEKNRETCR